MFVCAMSSASGTREVETIQSAHFIVNASLTATEKLSFLNALHKFTHTHAHILICDVENAIPS